MPIPPSPNRADPPDFYKLDATPFEEMTCALYLKEPHIQSADLYRVIFQPQYGIDVFAERIGGDGHEVASCKCYETISKGEIPQWSDHFLNHWEDHWKDKDVRKFVLVVAAHVSSRERDAEIQEQKRRFKEYGIKYEVWAPRILQEKIRKHPGLVSQFLGEYWVTRICDAINPTPIEIKPRRNFVIRRRIVNAQSAQIASWVIGIVSLLSFLYVVASAFLRGAVIYYPGMLALLGVMLISFFTAARASALLKCRFTDTAPPFRRLFFEADSNGDVFVTRISATCPQCKSDMHLRVIGDWRYKTEEVFVCTVNPSQHRVAFDHTALTEPVLPKANQ